MHIQSTVEFWGSKEQKPSPGLRLTLVNWVSQGQGHLIFDCCTMTPYTRQGLELLQAGDMLGQQGVRF